jgi:hypothetical protein
MKTVKSMENIHMKQKMMGVTFAIKSREAKDRYLDSQFKNALDELFADIANYRVDVVFRKLIMLKSRRILALTMTLPPKSCITT